MGLTGILAGNCDRQAPPELAALRGYILGGCRLQNWQ